MSINATSAGSKTAVTKVETAKENNGKGKPDTTVVTDTVTQFAGSVVQAQDAPKAADVAVEESHSSEAKQESSTADAAEPTSDRWDETATKDEAPATSTPRSDAPDTSSEVREEGGTKNDEVIKVSKDSTQSQESTVSTSESPAPAPGVLEQNGAANDKFIEETKNYAKQDPEPDRLEKSGAASDEFIQSTKDYADGKSSTVSTSNGSHFTPLISL